MKVLTLIGLILSFTSAALAVETTAFPQTPQPSLTPGDLCASGSHFRYPEKVRYCERAVSGDDKDQIVKRYDATFGYKIESIGRRNFKIDHFIPLCMGGSNEEKNLWPQHPSVYEVTDPLEPVLCQKMAEGRLKQADAVRMIKEAKLDLSKAPKILESVQTL